MSDKELRKLIDALQDVTDEYASNPEKARQFLKNAGILTNGGELSEPYRS
jgi:ABC-type nitrate/sulfonate/bicarbonate transport system substrate-binding protein